MLLHALVARVVRLYFILAIAVAAATFAISSSEQIHGAAAGYGAFSIYDTHSHLVDGATTPSGSWTVTQQGFYASGDGGSASYDWNQTSYCPGGTSRSPTAADGLTCILPSGQSQQSWALSSADGGWSD